MVIHLPTTAPENQNRFSRNFGQLINRMERKYRLYMDEHMRQYGINGRMQFYFIFLDKHPGSSQDALATHYVLDKCTVARSAKHLESSGYITRRVNDSDRRQNDLYLTDKGMDMLTIIRKCNREWGDRFNDVLTEQEQETMIALFERVVEHVVEKT